MFSSNLPRALLAEWPGSFTCYCGNTGLERIPQQESAQKADPRLTKTFSLRSCRDSNPRPFDHESDALTTELSTLPLKTTGLNYTSVCGDNIYKIKVIRMTVQLKTADYDDDVLMRLFMTMMMMMT